MDRGPVFVVGAERSGTSLMFALLASHPSLAMTRRTNLWTYFYNQYGDLRSEENFERCLTTMMRYKRLVRLQPDPDGIRREFRRGEATYPRLFAVLEQQYAERLGKSHWGDKSLNTERYADPIFDAYPNARIIHMVRDPRDRYASALTRWKSNRGGVASGLAQWLSSVQLARRNQERYPDRYMIVHYEALTSQPEATLASICAFIGEESTPDMLSMDGAREFRDKGGNSSYGRREPGRISTNSVGRFREVLSARQIRFMQMVARQEMLALGYELDGASLSPRDWLSFALTDLPVGLAWMVAWRAREAYLNRVGRKLPSYRIVPTASAQEASA